MTSGTPQRAPVCVPTWHGYVETTNDALLIFQACFEGKLHHCSRRPHDRERPSLIISGNVFVYEENTSGIKRWTDGIPWSPSRILTNFLIYRQLNSPFPPGEKKRATKRGARIKGPGDTLSTPTSSTSTPVTDSPGGFPPTRPPESPLARKETDSPEKDANRGLVGSLVDSYEFKEGGLLKKTMTVSVRGVHHHLVSYYSLEDAKSKLKTPRDDTTLKDLVIMDELRKQQKFKFPNYDDAGDGTWDSAEPPHGQYPGYYAGGGAYPGYSYQYPPSTMPYHHPYAPSQHHQSGQYGMPQSGSMYGPTAGHYAQNYSPHHQNYYHNQVPQPYNSSYPQQYSTQQAQMHTPQQPMAPVKQEAAAPSAQPYSYSTTPSQHSSSVNSAYGSHQSNGGPDGDEETVVPATSQPPPASNWPVNSYHQPWGAAAAAAGSAPRPEAANYAYRSQG